MIVAGPEGFQKSQYRKFNIKAAELTPGDDFGMMREVLAPLRLVKECAAGEGACGGAARAVADAEIPSPGAPRRPLPWERASGCRHHGWFPSHRRC